MSELQKDTETAPAQAVLQTVSGLSQPASLLQKMPPFVVPLLFILAFILAIILAAFGTLLSLSDDPVRIDHAYQLLWVNVPLITALGSYLFYRVWRVLFADQTTLAAPLLHRRFVLIFSLVALAPAIMLGTFSTTLIRKNINDLFGENVYYNINQARHVLNDYVEEQIQALIPHVKPISLVLNETANLLPNRISYNVHLQRLTFSRGLDAAYVLRSDGFMLAGAESQRAPEFKIPALQVFQSLQTSDKIGIYSRDDEDFLIALNKLDVYPDAYLYIGRKLPSQSPILSSIAGINKAHAAFERFEVNQSRINHIFALTFIQMAFLILFAAIWLGLILANRIITPLAQLVRAADLVRTGQLNTRVSVGGFWGEMRVFGNAFNRMTKQIASQRNALVRERDISEQRHQFSEAVLSGVRAGVIGLSQEGKIVLCNHSAERLLGMKSSCLIGQPIHVVLPDFTPVFTDAREDISGHAEDQVTMEMVTGVHNFDVRISTYEGSGKGTGWVLTFDDMTRLVAAQRHSAWREVAQRIAHEIKNPLTPIQLSVERLHRKYKNEINSDPDIFENCTQTIIRQVGSLEKMVDEFSTFARMPTPVFDRVSLPVLLTQCLFEQRVAFPDIRFTFEADKMPPVWVSCDERLINQALTNIVKNAAQAIRQRVDMNAQKEQDGHIDFQLEHDGTTISISCIDNGLGWPQNNKDRLLEPYVSSRTDGTGLGLAIVKRIVEDHGGAVFLHMRLDGQQGAHLQICLPELEYDLVSKVPQTDLVQELDV